jgi:hypothetical protein
LSFQKAVSSMSLTARSPARATQVAQSPVTAKRVATAAIVRISGSNAGETSQTTTAQPEPSARAGQYRQGSGIPRASSPGTGCHRAMTTATDTSPANSSKAAPIHGAAGTSHSQLLQAVISSPLLSTLWHRRKHHEILIGKETLLFDQPESRFLEQPTLFGTFPARHQAATGSETRP